MYLFLFLLTGTAAASPGSEDEKDAEKDEAVRHEKPVIEISHGKEFVAG
jgi:hypothetical protein